MIGGDESNCHPLNNCHFPTRSLVEFGAVAKNVFEDEKGSKPEASDSEDG